MNILMLCNKSPYPASEGGPMAMNSIVTGLLEAGHKVKILAVNSEKYHIKEKDIPKNYKSKTNIELIDVDLRIRPLKAFKNLFTDESYHVERFISQQFTNKLIEILKKDRYDIVQLEMIYMAPYIETIRQYSDAKIILRAHNVEHLIWDRIAKETKFLPKRWYINHLVRTLKKFEMETLHKVDGIAAITYRDAAFFRGETAVPVIDIPYGVNPQDFTPNYNIKETPTFYHIGSMNWMPNEEGIKWFVTKIWDKIIKKSPKASIYLAGRHMPKWLLNMRKDNIYVIGEVPDSKKFIEEHDVAIVPLLSGSGIRIKIIESMAMGKTVITTLVGAEGIQYSEYENIIIADTAAKMVEAVNRIMRDPNEASRIGQKARLLIEEVYDNKKIIDRLLIFYDEIGKTKKDITYINNKL
ncbi:MAG: glycosyltransferase family 4 protein [Lentimicrobiaceae bacterium]|nr:glycosyltransferase family 4 protein [Lentimicrobiaceae bacterium]